MPTPSARAPPPRRAKAGLREWLVRCLTGPEPPRLAIFDTRVSKVRRLPMAAGPAARRLGRSLGFEVLDRPAYFLVDDVRGPLAAGELERAVAWGRRLGVLLPGADAPGVSLSA